jgi:hypothetical protein
VLANLFGFYYVDFYHKEDKCFYTFGIHKYYLCEVDKWAYIDDLISVSVAKEEPVSGELEEAANAYISNENNYSHSRTDTFKAGANWQKEKTIRKACDWITEINNHHYIMRYSDSCEVTSKELIEWFKNYMEE